MDRHPRRLAFPVRVIMLLPDQMSADLLDPLGLDLRHGTGVHLGRLHLLGGHDPLRLGFEEERPWMNEQPGPAGADIFGLLLAQADVGEQARQQRPVYFAIFSWRLIQLEPQLALDDLHDLPVDVMPLGHAHIGQEVVAAVLAQLGPRQMLFPRLELLPELEQGQEIRVFILEARVFLVRMRRLVGGALTRIRYAQRGDDDGDFAQAMLLRAGQQHAAQPGVYRQPGQLAADVRQHRTARRSPFPLNRRERAAFFQGSEFLQRPHAVPDQARIGRFDEGEAPDFAQFQGMHLQDDGGEVRPQNFRVGEFRPVEIILFRIQANGDARPDTTATAGALVGGSLRNLLDRQPLQLAAM